MKIYTKQGDAGETGLIGGLRVSKDDSRIEAYGTVDELSAALGVVRAHSLTPDVDQLLAAVQNLLFTVGAQLASPDFADRSGPEISSSDIVELEDAIDRYCEQLPPLTQFILPGGVSAAAQLHQARVVCRRAERRVVSLGRHAAISDLIVAYLNRLGDLLFVLARSVNAAAGVQDVAWEKRS